MTMTIDLGGRVAIVTGAASGIGTEIARTLREAGARVALADLDEARLSELEGLGLPVRVDVTAHDSARAGVAGVREQLGSLDILVNNAGIAARTQGMPFTNQTKDDWESVLAVNSIGPFVMSREFVLQLGDDDRAAIVNIASISGRTGFQTDPCYSASKAALINFTQVMARDLAPRVRVNSICPGMLLTPFYRAQFEAAAKRDPSVAALGPEDYFEDKAKKLIPMGRGQEPRDIANAVAFLVSDLASSITGQALNVDGGLVMS